MRKALLVIGCVLLVVIAGGAVFVGSRQHLTFDAPYPEVVASTDSAVVERGHYIVRNLAPCASCHGDQGEGSTIAPSLKGLSSLPQRSKEDLLKILEDSEAYGLVAPMPKSFPKLSKEEKHEIVDWVTALK